MKCARVSSLAAAVALLAPAARAIPPFARKYQTSCATCHLAFPVLNSFGKAFRARGYRMPGGDEKFTKDKPVSLGAPAWKKVFPRAVWPSDIPGGSVAGFWLSSQYEVNPSAPVTNEFKGLDELDLLGGGTLGESFSFFLELEIIEDGRLSAEAGAAVPRAFFQYNHPSHKLNLTYGLIEPRAVVASSALRLVRINDYLANRYGMPPTANSFSLSPSQHGFEGWGHFEGPARRGGLEWFAGVVNGRDGGIPTGAAAFGAEELARGLESALAAGGRTNGENNSNKDIYLGLNYKVGGTGVLGGGLPDELDRVDALADNSVTFGGFWYRGTAPALLSSAGNQTLVRNGNHFTRAAAKMDAGIGRANLLAALQLNRDRLKGVRGSFDELITLAEGRYIIYPWLIPALRWEGLKPNFGPAFYRATLHSSLMLRANVRLALEGVWSRRDFRRFDSSNDRRFQVRLDFAY